jgi:hypothetical protein
MAMVHLPFSLSPGAGGWNAFSSGFTWAWCWRRISCGSSLIRPTVLKPSARGKSGGTLVGAAAEFLLDFTGGTRCIDIFWEKRDLTITGGTKWK